MIIIIFQILSLIGFLISLYFTLVYRNQLASNTPWIPKMCRMEAGDCDQIIRTPDAHLFGIPNFYLGIVLYAVCIVSPFIFKPFTGVADIFMIVLGVVVGTSLYLSYSLLRVLKKRCVLCFTTHIINLGLFLLLVYYQ